jgi:hypothetical protein
VGLPQAGGAGEHGHPARGAVLPAPPRCRHRSLSKEKKADEDHSGTAPARHEQRAANIRGRCSLANLAHPISVPAPLRSWKRNANCPMSR